MMGCYCNQSQSDSGKRLYVNSFDKELSQNYQSKLCNRQRAEGLRLHFLPGSRFDNQDRSIFFLSVFRS